MSAHAILSLRGRKYGDAWNGVWEYLERRYDFRPLGVDEAMAALLPVLRELPAEDHAEGVRGHNLRNATVLELIRDAHRMNLRQDHIRSLVNTITDDEARRAEILDSAADSLGWDRDRLSDWDSIPEFDISEARKLPPEIKVVEGVDPESAERFASAMNSISLLADTSVLDPSVCHASEAPGGADGATTVYGEFAMEASLDELRFATDPNNWPYCSWFFIAMKNQQDPVDALPLPDDVGEPEYDAYQTVFEELVGVEGFLTVRTSLTTRYFVGGDSVGMEFDLAPGLNGDGKLDVDHGYLLAERHPTDPGKVIVKSQKTFSFAGLDDLPFSFLCEFGWLDMMRAMAQCRKP